MGIGHMYECIKHILHMMMIIYILSYVLYIDMYIFIA